MKVIVLGTGFVGLTHAAILAERCGKVVACDNDPQKIGRTHDGIVVEPIESMAKVVPARSITLAVLSVPADAAQRVADQMVACGILGILNFAPVPLSVPPSVSVMAVDLSIQLEHLAYKVQNCKGGISHAG